MNAKLYESGAELLFNAVLSLKTPEECCGFFEDICTIPEIRAMSQRLVVAKMLYDKRLYSEITAETGASTATISRVSRSMNYGKNSYTVVFDRLGGKEAPDEPPDLS